MKTEVVITGFSKSSNNITFQKLGKNKSESENSIWLLCTYTWDMDSRWYTTDSQHSSSIFKLFSTV